MNEILKILEERELYSHLILMKVYLATNGRTNETFGGNLQKEFKELFGDEFDSSMFLTATQYLFSEGYVSNASATSLTTEGRTYFEGFVKNYQTITKEDKNLLLTKLPAKVTAFLGISANVVTVLDFLQKITQIK